MNKLIFVPIFLIFGIFANAQNKIKFNYDIAGNQTNREICLGNCVAGQSSKEIKEIEDLTDEDLEKFSSTDFISYYPNPVKEELYLKWELLKENHVNSVQVYSIGGQVLKTYSENNSINSLNIPFRDYPTGVYLIVINYTNGNPKTIKIIKQ